MTVAFVATVYFAVGASSASALSAPHVPTSIETDACAMCHRGHSSASDAWTEGSSALNPLSNALLTVPALGVGDTALCYSCHGVEQLGSESDVESAFISGSRHSLVPSSSAYGPTFKQCSSCHDSHGSARTSEGTTFPALLRAFEVSGSPLFEGEPYCGTCHADRPADTFDGMTVWEKTAHSTEMSVSADGTGIACLNCHDAHGSPNAPSIRTSLTTPSAPATANVGGNDRSLCFGCHTDDLNTYSGETSYTASVHAGSSATITIPGEWPARDLAPASASRRVGECQVCHAPMGRSDGSGGVIPKMLDKAGRQLCDQCHRVGGAAEESVIASLAYPTSRNDTELIAVWSPSAETSTFGEVAAWTTEVTTTVPAGLNGPRTFQPTGIVGDATSGDVDGNGTTDLLVADPTDNVLTLYQGDPVQGLRRSTLSIPGGHRAHLVLVADVVNELSGPVLPGPTQPEIAIISRDSAAPFTSALRLYTFEDGTLSAIGVPISVGNDASSIAAGDVTGSSTADIVVTARGDDEFRILTEEIIGTLSQSGAAHATGDRPRGASIGEIQGSNSGNEVAICNSVSTVSVFRGDGSSLGGVSAAGSGSANYASDSLIANVLWSETTTDPAAAELVVALRTDPTTNTVSGTSSINVFRQAADGSGLDSGAGWPQTYATGNGYESSTLAAGDIDFDGRNELAVGNAGKWARLSGRQAPSVQIFESTNGTSLSGTPKTLWSSGVEQASGFEDGLTLLPAGPPVMIANLGPVGPSRHPGDAAGPGSHVSTESADFARHVTCADCHNVHETTTTVQVAPASIYGALRGVWGTAISNLAAGADIEFAQKPAAVREYEICLKCHSANAGWANSRDVAAEINPLNPSMHAVQAPSANASAPASTFASVTADTFVNSATAWTKDSKLFCIDCHTNSDGGQAKGPHVSGDGGLLRKPYFGTLPSSSSLLCYTCHKYSVYYSGGAGSLFRDLTGGVDLHQLHTNQGGFSCRSCHTSHGSSTKLHLQGAKGGYTHTASGGACTTQCHTAGATRLYSRQAGSLPTSHSIVVQSTDGGYPLNDALASIVTSDTVSLAIRESATPETPVGGDTSCLEFRTDFTGISDVPTALTLVGWYDGETANHVVDVEVYDFTAADWVTVGALPSTTSQSRRSYLLADADFVSAGGEVRARILHLPPGSAAHYLNINAIWLAY